VACLSWQGQHAATPSTSRVRCARVKLGPLRSHQARTGCGRRSACAWLHRWGGSRGCGGGERNENSARVWKGCCLYMMGTYWAILGHIGPHIFLQTMSILVPGPASLPFRGSDQLPSRGKFDPHPCPVRVPCGEIVIPRVRPIRCASPL
jgi:hypothetical protein